MYKGTMRTNYFQCKDPQALADLLARSEGCEGETLELFTRNFSGETRYAFGCLGGLQGLKNEGEADKYQDDARALFLDELQELVAEGDACILMETGHEKLCVLVAEATVVTPTAIKHLDFHRYVAAEAQEFLGNPAWFSPIEY